MQAAEAGALTARIAELDQALRETQVACAERDALIVDLDTQAKVRIDLC